MTISTELYKRDTSGKIRTWQYEVDGDSYRTIAGVQGGNLVTGLECCHVALFYSKTTHDFLVNLFDRMLTIDLDNDALFAEEVFGAAGGEGGVVDGGVVGIREYATEVTLWVVRVGESVEVIVDTSDPTHLVLVEHWDKAESDEAYHAWRATPEGRSSLREILDGAPVVTQVTAFDA